MHIRVEYADGDVSEGSGFVTIAKGLVVTNAHVVGMLDNDSPKPKKIEATFNGGDADSKTVEVKVGYVDGESDLALLAMSAKDAATVTDLLTVALSQTLTETQDVFVVGFPLGKQAGPNVTVTATTVTSLRKEGGNLKQVQVNGGIHPGNSGGPVVDKDGKLVGIAVASYAGTQLHLAIPTEALNSVTNGRVMNSAYGVPYRDGDKIKVPFRFEKADPLGKMKSIAIETWTGKAGPLRAAASKKPDPLPEDSPVTVLEVKPDEKNVYSGEIELEGNKDTKHVYWTRYKMGRAGDQYRWYPGTVFNAAQTAPVERKAATLKYEPAIDKQDTLALNSDASLRIREATGDDTLLNMNIKGKMQEKVLDKAKDGKVRKRLSYEGLETTTTVDKKPLRGPGADALAKALKDISLLASEVEVDRDGTISRNLVDFGKVPRTSQRPLSLVLDQLGQSMDSLSLPLPLKEVVAQETWKGTQSYVLGALGYAVPAKAEVTYKYEGVYLRDNKPMAVITFEGPLEGMFPKSQKGKKPPSLAGKVDGRITVAADTGVVQSATEKIRAEASTEVDGKPIKFIGTLNVTLTRSPGVLGKTNTGTSKTPTPSKTRSPAGASAIRPPTILGGAFDPEFKDLAPEGGLLVGFEFGLVKVFDRDWVRAAKPIYRAGGMETTGEQRGTQLDNVVTLKAKDGYAVGAISAKHGLRFDGLSVTFMKVVNGKLNPKISYESEYVGTTEVKNPTKLGGDGTPVVGIVGKFNDKEMTGMGLVFKGQEGCEPKAK
ncbi:S1 family peptidase [Fimbriiglobus ruber]|uniref:Serine protease DO-like n=1 Tax=Fimbriiglobus ruber TaxID=1908690 RepID=A0A225DBD8_9BACT|nr:serine protease [Fimbriiglobus ruber]OWK35838.1 Serine protease DO-like [Fimbriiglobus ruber]